MFRTPASQLSSDEAFSRQSSSLVYNRGHGRPDMSRSLKQTNSGMNSASFSDAPVDLIARAGDDEKLREYERVVEELEEMIVVVDRDYRYLLANRAYLESHKVKYEEVVGRFVWEVLDREYFDQVVKPNIDRAFAGQSVKYETDYRYSTQGWRRLLVLYSPIEHDGRIERVACVLRDITERKRANEALRLAEQKYRDIFENAGEGIFQSTREGQFIAANPALARMCGYDSPEGLITNCTDIQRQLYADPRVREEYLRAMETHGTVRGFEAEMFRSDGQKRLVSVNARAVRDESGRTLYYEGTALDITERKNAEAALRESEERYRELFENSKDAIYMHDLSGRYVSANRAAEELTGYQRAEILGKHYSNFISPRYLREARENFCRKIDLPIETIYEAEVVCKNGTRKPVEVSSRMIYKEGQVIGVQGTVRDISERKRAEDVLKTYSRRLLEAQEVERQKIARELHDEIGQVLTAVRLNLQSIKISANGNAESRIDESMSIVDQALRQVRELSLELRPSLLDELGLVAALRWYSARYSLRSGIETSVTCESEINRIPHEVSTACFRIAQEALTNSARHSKATKANVSVERRNGELRLTIQDNGVGFDAGLFLNGMGSSALGLRGMQERALAVGGHILINSDVGKGAEVKVIVPLKKI